MKKVKNGRSYSNNLKCKAMNKYTVYYKRISNSPFVSATGKNSSEDMQTCIVEAGNTAGAKAKVIERQKMFMNREIRVISIIPELPEED